MKINILIPHKEHFDKDKLSSVSITVINNFNHSKFKKNIKIFGKDVQNSALPHNFIPIKNSFNIFKSKNIHLAQKMCEHISNDSDKEQLIEIHNRPKLFNYVVKKLKGKFPVNIFFHNNPLDMSGSQSLSERKKIVRDSAAILCVSNFIKTKFLTGFKTMPSNIFVLHNGVERKLKKFPNKKKEILFVGRLVEEKGFDLFVNVAEKLAKKLPDWKFCIVGSSHLGEKNEKSIFANTYSKKFLKIGKQAYFTGYLNNNEVQNKMKTASIVIVPSLWEEPFGLVIIEAMSNGAAIITTNSGGIPEVIKSNGIIIKNISQEKLARSLSLITSDKKKLRKYQDLSWKNFSHTAFKSSKKLDIIRTRIMGI